MLDHDIAVVEINQTSSGYTFYYKKKPIRTCKSKELYKTMEILANYFNNVEKLGICFTLM